MHGNIISIRSMVIMNRSIIQKFQMFVIISFCVDGWLQYKHAMKKGHLSFRDREIQFFELSSFEPYCQISNLETVPLRLHYR